MEPHSLPGLEEEAGLRLWGGSKLKCLLLRLTLECQQEKMKVVFRAGFIYLWLFFACCCFNFSLLLSFPVTLSLSCSPGSCTPSQHCRSWLFLIWQSQSTSSSFFFLMFCLCVSHPFILFFLTSIFYTFLFVCPLHLSLLLLHFSFSWENKKTCSISRACWFSCAVPVIVLCLCLEITLKMHIARSLSPETNYCKGAYSNSAKKTDYSKGAFLDPAK